MAGLMAGVKPVSCHSHNDYWRPYPLYSAIRAGCVGVEADVWLYGDELYVGHTTATLAPNRTFRSLYVDPLAEILDARNAGARRRAGARGRSQSHGHGHGQGQDRPVGVFIEAPYQTLVLLVDFKMDGEQTWPYFMEQLAPLRERGYLSYFDGTARVDGPVTVVATGNAPFGEILRNAHPRDVFYDAPLGLLSSPPSSSPPSSSPPTDADGDRYDHTNSYYASASFKKLIGTCWGWMLSEAQVEQMRAHVRAAHERGLLVR
ncbi:Altered inheritance of mitochondria protein 6, partial [Ascosphaera acerosa]